MYSKLASQIINDVYSGLSGLHNNLSLSVELLEDEIVQTRLTVIKEYQMKGILPINDLVHAINCIDVDCESFERCPSCRSDEQTLNAHFEIPQIISDFGELSILYIGSTDRQNSFDVYMSPNYTNSYAQYRKRGKHKPFIYIDPAPNKNNMLDCFIFNAPLIDLVSVVAVFKDPRLLEQFGCCDDDDSLENLTFIDSEVKERLTQKKLAYYRQYATKITPNDQNPK